MARAKRKLLVPVTVSFTSKRTSKDYTEVSKMRGRGTKAFAEVGTNLRDLNPKDKFMMVKTIGDYAPYFIKPMSKKVRKIISLLERNGVAVEKPIEDLKNGTMLFEKIGFCAVSNRGFNQYCRAPRKIFNNIVKEMIKMHMLGVTHGHLHLGNFALTEKGKAIIIDLKRATVSSKDRLEKGKNAERIAWDVVILGHGFTSLDKDRLKLTNAQSKKRGLEIHERILLQYPPEMRIIIANGLKKLIKKAEAKKQKK